MNQVILTGHLGADPDLSEAPSVERAAFRLATHERFRRRDGEYSDHTEWHRVVAWNGLARSCRHLQKGSHILVEGRLRTWKWEDSDGNPRATTEVVARRIEFLGPKPGSAVVPGEGPREAANEA